MFNWLRKRRLSGTARRKLLIVSARSEEAIIETHVENVLDLLHTLQGDVDLDRGLELYAEMMSLDETLTSTVTNRVLARVGAPSPRATAERARRFENVFRGDLD